MTILAEIPTDIWDSIARAGPSALLMALAVWWLQKTNRELVTALNSERSERLDAMENHIVACDTDRKELRDMLLRHLGATTSETLSLKPKL